MTKEHIFQISVAVDDDTIREGIIKSCESQIVQSFKKEFYDTDYYGRTVKPNRQLCDIVDRRVAQVVADNKDEIIGLIVERVCDKIMRSKAFKDKLNSIMEDEETSDEQTV